MRWFRFLSCLIIAACCDIANATQAPEAASNLSISAEAWRADLEFVRTELPKRHINAFHTLSRTKFERNMRRLEEQAAVQNPDERYAELAKVINSIGDGHTGLTNPPDRAYMPIEIQRFGEEYRVTRAAPGAERAIRARVIAINGTPIENVAAQVHALTPADENATLRDSLTDNLLSYGLILHGLGVTADHNRAQYLLQSDSGQQFTLELAGSPKRDKSTWVTAYPRQLLSDSYPNIPFWCRLLRSSKTIYCDFRGYDGLGRRVRQMFALLRDRDARKLVIDLRQNGGGDYTVGESKIIKPLSRLRIAKARGRVFVLVGPQTFSAAMNNAAQFRSMLHAVLIGDTIGERPNSYQEVKEVALPNSKIVLRYSTRWYAFVKGGPNEIAPDVHAVPSWGQFKQGIDPALEFALRRAAK